MNWLQIAGHLGADPDERHTPSGQKVISLNLATTSRKGGKDETIWWRVTIWGDRFDKMMPYLKKGSPLMVYGEMTKPRIYTNKEGQPQVACEMVAEAIKFSPFGRGTDNKNESQSNKESGISANTSSMNQNNNDDEIPF